MSEQHKPEKIGFLDIEASDLKANYGMMFSYCIKVAGEKKIYEDHMRPKDFRSKTLDKRLVKHCIEDMKRFDRIVGYYSGGFDIPFIRTRALRWRIDFPEYYQLLHTDVYNMAKHRLCLHSYRQNIVCEAILGHTEKSRLKPDVWLRAAIGDTKAMEYIVDHNRRDVRDLERVYLILKKYAKTSKASI
jgi:uncharacterized protein YprB with RNaseH-like and TPR domain